MMLNVEFVSMLSECVNQLSAPEQLLTEPSLPASLCAHYSFKHLQKSLHYVLLSHMQGKNEWDFYFGVLLQKE